MPTWLVKLFQSLGRKQAAKRTGIAQIPDTITAEGRGASHYTTLRDAGFKDEDLVKRIRSEKDIIRLVNTVEAIQKQRTPKVISHKKKDPLEWTKGWTPKVIEGGGTSLDDFLKLKGEYYRRLITNVDDDVKAFSKRVIEKKQDVRLDRLTKDQRKDFLNMVDDRLKMGNRKFIEKYDDTFPPPDYSLSFDSDFASGGLARVGMFGGGPAKKIWQEFVEKLFKKEMTKPTFRNLNPKNKEWAKQQLEKYNKKMPALTKQFEEFKKTGELPKDMGVHKDYFRGYDTKKLRNKEVDYDYYREILDDAENDFVLGDETCLKKSVF